MNNLTHQVVIIANGEYPTHAIPLRVVQEAKTIVCCDHLPSQLQRCPDIIVGDGDSLTPQMRQHYQGRIVINPDQETNDLTKAVHYCQQQGLSDIAIVGATGLREDHTIANISLLMTYPDVLLYTDYGTFTAIHHSRTFASFPRQQVSLFSMCPDIPISVRGLRYPIENRCLRQWWEGSLNEALANSFQVIVTNGEVIVYQTYDAKP